MMFSSAFRHIVQLSRAVLKPTCISTRCASLQTFEHINISVDSKTGIAVLSMNRAPVNSLNLEMLTDLKMAISTLEEERKCRALIVTSTQPKIFTAGIDILEMYQPDPERLKLFWKTFQDLWVALYGSNLITVAAINGNSPAGGCMLSMGCDYRIMAEGKYVIGLNETKLGIVAPFWLQDAMLNIMGHRQTEMALQLGSLFTANEALAVNLIDRIVPESNIINAANEELQRWLKIPDLARYITKQQIRTPTLEKFAKNRDEDLLNVMTLICGPRVQKGLGRYLEGLKKKKSS